MGGAGEAVTLVDATGEAWVFHICGGTAAGRFRWRLRRPQQQVQALLGGPARCLMGGATGAQRTRGRRGQ